MLNVIMLSAVHKLFMLSAIMLNGVMLNVVAPYEEPESHHWCHIFQKKKKKSFSRKCDIQLQRLSKGRIYLGTKKCFPGVNIIKLFTVVMKQHTFKSVNNRFDTNIYSYLETSGGHGSDLYLNVVNFFNTSVN